VIEDITRCFLLLFTYFFAYLAVRKIVNTRNKINALSIFAILWVVSLNFLAFKIDNEVLKGVVTYSGFTIYACEIKRSLNKEAIVDGFISYVHVVSLDIFLAVVLSISGFSDFVTKSDNLSVYKLIYSSICAILLYITLYIPFWYKLLAKIKGSLNNSKVFVITISLILLVIETATIVTLMQTKSLKDVVLTIILITLFLACLAYLLFYALKKQDLSEKNDNLIIQSDTLLKILNNYKLFKHNMKHELLLIESVGNDKVKKLVKEYLKEHSAISSSYNVKGLENIPNSFKTFIYHKLLDKADFKFDLFVDNSLQNDPFENLSSKKLSTLYQAIGIALDNAIEAASEIDSGFVYIKFQQVNNKTKIVFENKFKGNISVDEISNPGETTKEGHMGVGIGYIISQRVIDSKITIRNDVFIVTLSI